MIAVFLGPDDFTKLKHAEEAAKEAKANVEVFSAPESLPSALFSGTDLFGSKKMYAIKEGLKFLTEGDLAKLERTGNTVFFFEYKVDKRLKTTKDLLSSKLVTVKDFPLPHGKELNHWIQVRVKELNGKFSQGAVEALAVALGRDQGREVKFGGRVVETAEVFTLWQAESEIQKLLAFSAGEEVSAEAVKALVSENKEADVLDIVNAIGEKNKQRALDLVQVFLNEQTSSDEKGKIIQLNALLSEQFRNVSLVQSFTVQKTPEARVLEQTEWKSGRLFIMKKIASHFESKKVLQLLDKLSALDEELKNSSTPPRVLLDLILVQLF